MIKINKRLGLYTIVSALIFVLILIFFAIQKYSTEVGKISLGINIINHAKPNKISLDVPYINEAPDGNFSGNWKNACEEASMIMVEKYYLGEKTVGVNEAKAAMQLLFDYQDRLYGSNVNSDAQRTKDIIDNNLHYTATIIENPSIEQLKQQIQKKQPVITLHYGFTLHNPNIPFAVNGSYYHQMVLIGYDDTTKEFITNDDGDQKYGPSHRYGYDLFMSSLHDYSYVTRKTNLPARVIFTSSK